MYTKSFCSSICVTALLALVLAASQADAIFCQQPVTTLVPCSAYLQGKADKPSKQCCNSANSLNGLAKKKADRISLCECLKEAVNSHDLGIKADRAKAISNVCKIKLAVPFDPKVDCKKLLN